MVRREAREELFRMVFEMSFKTPDELEEIISNAVERDITDSYIFDTLRGLYIHLDGIDNKIAINANEWKFERISKVSLSIMRISVYEMLYTELPCQISINEAVELAKKYDDEKAPKFVNGILNKIAKEKKAEDQ